MRGQNSQRGELPEILKRARLNTANLVVIQRPTISGQKLIFKQKLR